MADSSNLRIPALSDPALFVFWVSLVGDIWLGVEGVTKRVVSDMVLDGGLVELG